MADKSKDTGTGGINIGGDLYTMDVGQPDGEGGKRGQWSPGDVAVDDSRQDLAKPTRETFARYLSKTTLGQVGAAIKPNPYPVGIGESTAVQEVALKDKDGYPVRPAESPNENKFKSVQVGSPPPPLMKKGSAPGDLPDGPPARLTRRAWQMRLIKSVSRKRPTGSVACAA